MQNVIEYANIITNREREPRKQHTKGAIAMRTLCICNLKGGVAKTTTAINLAYSLATAHKKRVLLVDNDKQGSVSNFFGVHSYEQPSVADLLLGTKGAAEVIRHTQYNNLDVIPANMNLLRAEQAVLTDTETPQQTRLKKALDEIDADYDYCIIDNAPDAGMGTLNALVAGDDVIIPVKIDQMTFDGVDVMLDVIGQVKANFNERITFQGCVITSFRGNDVNRQGAELLEGNAKYKLLQSRVYWTAKVDEASFGKIPVMEYSPRSWAARGYKKLATEYMTMIGAVSESDTKKGRN